MKAQGWWNRRRTAGPAMACGPGDLPAGEDRGPLAAPLVHADQKERHRFGRDDDIGSPRSWRFMLRIPSRNEKRWSPCPRNRTSYVPVWPRARFGFGQPDITGVSTSPQPTGRVTDRHPQTTRRTRRPRPIAPRPTGLVQQSTTPRAISVYRISARACALSAADPVETFHGQIRAPCPGQPR